MSYVQIATFLLMQKFYELPLIFFGLGWFFSFFVRTGNDKSVRTTKPVRQCRQGHASTLRHTIVHNIALVLNKRHILKTEQSLKRFVNNNMRLWHM